MRNGERLCLDIDKTKPEWASYNSENTFDADIFFNHEALSQEEVYMKIMGTITYDDESSKHKIKEGNLLLTTHRIIFFKGSWGLELPLHYVGTFEKTGGFGIFRTDGIKLVMWIGLTDPAPYIIDLYENIYKKPCPPMLDLPKAATIRFHDKNRDKFLQLAKEAH